MSHLDGTIPLWGDIRLLFAKWCELFYVTDELLLFLLKLLTTLLNCVQTGWGSTFFDLEVVLAFEVRAACWACWTLHGFGVSTLGTYIFKWLFLLRRRNLRCDTGHDKLHLIVVSQILESFYFSLKPFNEVCHIFAVQAWFLLLLRSSCSLLPGCVDGVILLLSNLLTHVELLLLPFFFILIPRGAWRTLNFRRNE